MAPNHDEQMQQRRQRREEMRRKQRAEQLRLKIGLIAAAIVLVICGISLYKISTNPKPVGAESPNAQANFTPETTAPAFTRPQPTTEPPRGYQEPISIHIKAAQGLITLFASARLVTSFPKTTAETLPEASMPLSY